MIEMIKYNQSLKKLMNVIILITAKMNNKAIRIFNHYICFQNYKAKKANMNPSQFGNC